MTIRLGRFALAAWMLLLVGAAAAQISPGPLARAHQSLNGAGNCTTCHKLGAGEAQFKCLDCHTEITRRLAGRRGLHASFGLPPNTSQGCVRCHSDHNGEDFPLIKWDVPIAKFDHSKTGYVLEGKHAGLSCDKCHMASHVSAVERGTIRMKDLNRTFLGLSPACLTCHQDQHQGRLGAACQQCHNSTDWKDVSQFDHAKTRYPLTGLHEKVTCAKCHTPGADSKPRYTGLAFGKCSDCHADPHKAAFPQSCQSCHNTGGWKWVAQTALSQQFDHAKTKYPLLGKHRDVGCEQCHANGDFKKPLASARCMDCHRPDPHGGQFAGRADAGECASCHTVDGFKPAKFGVKEHAATKYPLEAKHATVECAKCHLPKGKDTLYKIKFDRCANCHADQHVGQFASAPYLNRCESCHNLQGYRPATYTVTQHQKSSFVLTGGHIAVACGDCHKESDRFKPKPVAQYHWESLSCTSCHADPHNGQFEQRMLAAGSGRAGCETCHSTQSWNELSRFDHSKTQFALTGTHRATACIDCHKPPNLEARLMHVDFKAAPTQCQECHADVHGSQFAAGGKATACADCHNTGKWKPSLFDHDKRTGFPLQGVHRNVRCEACHKLTREVAEKRVLFYKPTPKECAACHGAAQPQRK